MPRDLPTRLTTSQFLGVLGTSLKEGHSLARAQHVLKNDTAVKRAMVSGTVRAQTAMKAMDVLKREGLLKGTYGKSNREMFHAAVRVGQEKGVFGDAAPTLHEQAIVKRREDRIKEAKEYERRKENLESYKKEIAAEKGQKTSASSAESVAPSSDSVVRMQEHGVAARADAERASHGVAAQAAPKPLKDIMFD